MVSATVVAMMETSCVLVYPRLSRLFPQLREEAVADEELRQAATANTLDNFRYVFVKALEGLFIDRMEQNEELFAKYMNDADFRKLVSEHLLRQVYEQIRGEGEA